jgi:hypothetical protein
VLKSQSSTHHYDSATREGGMRDVRALSAAGSFGAGKPVAEIGATAYAGPDRTLALRANHATAPV